MHARLYILHSLQKMIFSKKWQEQQYLNKGSYAKVFRVRLNGKDFALKKIYPHILKDPAQKQIIQREILIMSNINHPKIIKLHRAFIEDDEISLLLEFASGGSLFDQLNIYKKLPERQVKKYVKDIIQALEYLHSRPCPILHRDIKPQNLLIDAEGNCKLADFGSANMLDGTRNSYVGTEEYMAPEMQKCLPHGIQIDVWTLGVLIYELLTGSVPGEEEHFPSFLSRPAEDVIKKLRNKDQNKRMTLQELKDHIWLSDMPQILPISTMNQGKPVDKIQAMKQRLNDFTSSKETVCKSSGFGTFQKQKSTMQENEEVNREVKNYISLLKERDRLKHQVLVNQKIIEQEERRRMMERPFLLQEIDRVKKQIKQYESNILILRCKPLKMQAQCRQIIRLLKKKVQQLKQYVNGLSQRTKSEILHFPSYQPSVEPLPLSEYIFRLKTQIMTSRRDALIELRAVKKMRMDIMEMTQLQEQLDLEKPKEESVFEESSSSSLSFKEKVL